MSVLRCCRRVGTGLPTFTHLGCIDVRCGTNAYVHSRLPCPRAVWLGTTVRSPPCPEHVNPCPYGCGPVTCHRRLVAPAACPCCTCPQPPLGTRRTVFLSGMVGAEIMEVIAAYKDEGACAMTGRQLARKHDTGLAPFRQRWQGARAGQALARLRNGCRVFVALSSLLPAEVLRGRLAAAAVSRACRHAAHGVGRRGAQQLGPGGAGAGGGGARRQCGHGEGRPGGVVWMQCGGTGAGSARGSGRGGAGSA